MAHRRLPPLAGRHGTVVRRSLLLLLGWTASCTAPEPTPPVGEEAAVVAAVTAYYEDFSSRDWPRYSAHFWDGAILATLWQAPGDEGESVFVSSVPDFVARAPEGPDSQPIFEEVMEDVEVRVDGDLATAWARYRARFGRPGDLMEWRGIDAFTLLRHDGEWRIVSLVYHGT